MNKEKEFSAIIAVNNLGFIGLNDILPWRCSEDLKYFKKITNDKIIIVGHNTFLSLPPLPNRYILIDKKENIFDNQEFDQEVICIGGKATYEKYTSQFTKFYISHINDNTIGDVTFPDLSNLNPNCEIINLYFDGEE